jgi:hypothetical protein
VNVDGAAGVVLIVAPLWFNANFALLGKRFDYPDILRRPTAEILERFRAGGSSLILLWWTFMLSGLLLIAGAVLLGQVLEFGGIVPVATTIGVLAGLVQMLGLLRWVYVVPALARAYSDPTLGPEQREAHATVFRALHQYLGVGVGEHLGYLFTGIWSVLIGVGVIQGTALPTWLGWPGVVIGAGLAVGSSEFLGPNEERGLGSRRSSDPTPLRRVVTLAARDGHRVDRLIFPVGGLPGRDPRGHRGGAAGRGCHSLIGGSPLETSSSTRASRSWTTTRSTWGAEASRALPDEAHVPKALQVLAGYHYLHARYYGSEQQTDFHVS